MTRSRGTLCHENVIYAGALRDIVCCGQAGLARLLKVCGLVFGAGIWPSILTKKSVPRQSGYTFLYKDV